MKVFPKHLVRTIMIICMSTFILSCGRPECKNINPLFDKYSPETREYKNELVKQLKLANPSKLSYVLDKYQEDDSLQYLHVFIQGDGVCAKGIVIVKNWDDQIEGIRKTKGEGYSGVELINLKVDIYQDSARTELTYQSVDAIVD
jgi:hypothetical protein